MAYRRTRMRRGVAVYSATIRIHPHPVISRTFDTREEREAWIAREEARIRLGRNLPELVRQAHTLRDALLRWAQEHLSQLSEQTRKTEQARIRWWVERMGETPLSQITPSMIAAAKSDLVQAHKSPTTALHYMKTLRATLNLCVREWEWLESSPLDRVKLPRPSPGRESSLTHEERERLIEACHRSRSPYLADAIYLILSTGARFSEVAKAKWEWVDLENGYIRLPASGTKSKRARTLILDTTGIEILRRRHQALGSPYVFPGIDKITGEIVPDRPVTTLKTAWAAVRRAAGVPQLRIHDLRHDFATSLIAGGASLAQTAEALGHSTFNMVKRYAHLQPEGLAEAIRKMNQERLSTKTAPEPEESNVISFRMKRSAG